MRQDLEKLLDRIRSMEPCEAKVCIDTAPVLERSLARLAGLGWIGKNTCLINEPQGSWFFLGEIITSLDLEPATPPPDRCDTCTRCIEACPTEAIVPDGTGWTLDSRLCISYLTIELRGPIPEELRDGIGSNLYGCDICQDVCPWNREAPFTNDEAYTAASFPLSSVAGLDALEFRERFRGSPMTRAKHAGLLRNAAVVMGNTGGCGEQLVQLAAHENPVVREHAAWALRKRDAG
jgi:epoxyqueuosine reductase